MPEVRSIEAAVDATNVTISGVTETVCVTSPVCQCEYQTQSVVIIGWAQVTTGSDATSLAPRIRRGSSASGTLLNEANIEQVKAAAGSTEAIFSMAVDTLAGVNSAQYVLTVKQAGGTADGTVLQGGIIVIML
jgi:hypothetical protein